MGKSTGKMSRKKRIRKFNKRIVSKICSCEQLNVSVEEERFVDCGTLGSLNDLVCGCLDVRPYPNNFFGKFLYYFSCCCNEIMPAVCCPPCPQSVVNKLALTRMKKPTYEFVPFGSIGADESKIDYRLHFGLGASLGVRQTARRYQAYVPQVRCFYINYGSKYRIACMYVGGLSISNPFVSTDLTVLYSHSNGCDLGICVGYVVRLARRFGCNVLCYDYSGFGQSTGPCSEEGVYKSADVVYEYLTKTMKVPPEKIVAIGSSLGTAATIHIAQSRPVKGIILQGAFLSAYRVLCPFKRSVSSNDTYRNIDKITNIRVPSLFVHGQKDEFFSVRHAKLLSKNCPGAADVEPFYINNCGHLDFEGRVDYWSRVHEFMHRELFPGVREEVLCCSQRTLEWFRKERGNPWFYSESEASSTPSSTATTSTGDPPPTAPGPTQPVHLCDKCLKASVISKFDVIEWPPRPVPAVKSVPAVKPVLTVKK